MEEQKKDEIFIVCHLIIVVIVVSCTLLYIPFDDDYASMKKDIE